MPSNEKELSLTLQISSRKEEQLQIIVVEARDEVLCGDRDPFSRGTVPVQAAFDSADFSGEKPDPLRKVHRQHAVHFFLLKYKGVRPDVTDKHKHVLEFVLDHPGSKTIHKNPSSEGQEVCESDFKAQFLSDLPRPGDRRILAGCVVSANAYIKLIRRDLFLCSPFLKERLSPAIRRRYDEAVEGPVPYTGPVSFIPCDDPPGLPAGTVQYIECFRKPSRQSVSIQ